MNDELLNQSIILIAQALNNSHGAIPISITTTQNQGQFLTSVILALFGSIFVLFYVWIFTKPLIAEIFIKTKLRSIVKKTKRPILFIKHTEQSLFGGSMIDTNTMLKLSKALSKFKGKPFDLVLHTPGGEIFSSMFISRILKTYPSQIRTFIPFYAMSGGTLLALSGSELYMSPISCIGPVDPQLGNLFKFGSAKAWDKIVKFKGKKAEDSSISFAMMGNQYTKSIATHINNLLLDRIPNAKQRLEFVRFLTSGEVEHAYALRPTDVKKFGLPVKILPSFIQKALAKIISSDMYEGVYSLGVND